MDVAIAHPVIPKAIDEGYLANRPRARAACLLDSEAAMTGLTQHQFRIWRSSLSTSSLCFFCGPPGALPGRPPGFVETRSKSGETKHLSGDRRAACLSNRPTFNVLCAGTGHANVERLPVHFRSVMYALRGGFLISQRHDPGGRGRSALIAGR